MTWKSLSEILILYLSWKPNYNRPHPPKLVVETFIFTALRNWMKVTNLYLPDERKKLMFVLWSKISLYIIGLLFLCIHSGFPVHLTNLSAANENECCALFQRLLKIVCIFKINTSKCSDSITSSPQVWEEKRNYPSHKAWSCSHLFWLEFFFFFFFFSVESMWNKIVEKKCLFEFF